MNVVVSVTRLLPVATALALLPGPASRGAGDGVRVALDTRHARLAATPASARLLRHARAFAYDVPRESEATLARGLVSPRESKSERGAAAGRAIALFDGSLREDPVWVSELRRALPPDADVRVSLYLTFGCDVGASMPGTASLNAAHRRFGERPSELRAYAIHECHHAVFRTYQRPRPVAEWTTAADLLAQAEYALQLERMVVWAARDLREREGTLGDDEAYAALGDGARLARLEARYLEAHRALEARAGERGPADEATRALLLDLSGPDRVFYRVGALAARRVEEARGRKAVARLVKAGPRTFFEAYRAKAAAPRGLVPSTWSFRSNVPGRG
jgi:hypothetical protein